MALISEGAEQAFRRMRAAGRVSLPYDPGRARLAASQMQSLATSGDLAGDMSLGRMALIRSERKLREINREFLAAANPQQMAAIQGMRKQGTSTPSFAMGGGHMSDIALAWPKMRDPFMQFREKSWFWLEADDFSATLKRVREWGRLIYMTHHLVPSMIDVYSRFPILDPEFSHKDSQLASFYEDLFMEQLDYNEFLFDMNREYWVAGEAFPLGSWNESLGCWDGEELLNPDDVTVALHPALRIYQFHVQVPAAIRELIKTREPREEYQLLMERFPHVIEWAQADLKIPVSGEVLKQLKFKANPWTEHGAPILMRALQTLQTEMSLVAAQDAIADRLYAPLILARIGLDNVDDQGPYIPDPEELQGFRDDLSIALMADFRVLVYHHGLQVENVFGREEMPDLSMDFDRVDLRLMQIFGMGQEMLSGGQSGVPYASGALNRDVLTNTLSTHQNHIKKFLRQRMESVALAQGHFEVERAGGIARPVMEPVLMLDEETGETWVEERPKLAIPTVSFRTMNFDDDNLVREFLITLEESGVPISARSKMVNLPFKFDEEVEIKAKEKVTQIMAEQRMKMELFEQFAAAMELGQNIPIPAVYAEEFQAWLGGMMTASPPIAADGIETPAPTPELTPGALMLPGPPGAGGDEEGDDEGPPSPGVPQRPKESDEQRGPAKKSYRVLGRRDWQSHPVAGKRKAMRLMTVPTGTTIVPAERPALPAFTAAELNGHVKEEDEEVSEEP